MSLLPSRRTGDDCPSDFRLDGFVAGDLPAEVRAAVRAHCDTCDACGARLSALSAQAARFDRPFPTAPTRRRRSWVPVAALAAMAAGIALVVAWPTAEPEPVGGGESGVRLKGGVGISALVARGDRVRPLDPRDRVAPGDRLQFRTTFDAARHVAILSRDGAGVVSVYFPPGGTESARVPAGAERELESSTILDATLGLERVYALVCDAPFELSALRRSLEVGEAPEPPRGCALERFELRKAAP